MAIACYRATLSARPEGHPSPDLQSGDEWPISVTVQCRGGTARLGKRGCDDAWSAAVDRETFAHAADMHCSWTRTPPHVQAGLAAQVGPMVYCHMWGAGDRREG